MAKLNKKIFTPRVPDQFAIGVALALFLTASVSLMDTQADGSSTVQESKVVTTPLRAEKPDPTSDDATSRSGLSARFLLFRRG